MRVAVTGGGGFIGAHLMARLLGAGIDVTLLGADSGKSRYVAALVAARAVRFAQCDAGVRDLSALRSGLADADALVHLRYVAPTASSTPAELLEQLDRNVESTDRLLQAAEGHVRHVVFASSDSVYGSPTRTPVRESDATSPRTPFAAGKLACERIVRTFCSTAGASSTILRYANIYGPGEPCSRPIPTFIRAALSGQWPLIDGEGFDERDYVHVSDAADATLSALRRQVGGTYNVGSGIGTTTIELAELIAWISERGRAPDRRSALDGHGDRTSLVLDISRAISVLGFAPRHALADGIAEEIGWFKGEAASEARVLVA